MPDANPTAPIFTEAADAVLALFPEDERKNFDPTIIASIIATIISLIQGCKNPTPASVKAFASDSMTGHGWGLFNRWRLSRYVGATLRAKYQGSTVGFWDFVDLQEKLTDTIAGAGMSADSAKLAELITAAEAAK